MERGLVHRRSEKLPSIKLNVPKPKLWDLITGAVVVAGCLLFALNWNAAQGKPPGTSLSGELTLRFVLLQLLICLSSLMLLGRTAKQGTIWGNLAAVGGMFVGLSGVLLAAALWAAA